MNSSRKSGLALMLVAALSLSTGLSGIGRGAAPSPAPTPRSIAVVNLVKLFASLLEKASADTDLAAMKQKSDTEAAASSAKIEKLKKDLGTFKEGSDQFKDTQKELLRQSISLDIDGKVSDAEYQNEARLHIIDLYAKINEAVAAYAKANGIGLVLVADSADPADVRNPDQFQTIVTTRKIIYFDPAYDITKQVTEKMNIEFQLRTPAKK